MPSCASRSSSRQRFDRRGEHRAPRAAHRRDRSLGDPAHRRPRRAAPARGPAGHRARTRWLLLNSPSNPSGAAYDEQQLRPLLEVLRRHPQVWLLSDDIYEHLLYDGAAFVTAAQLEPELKERTLTVNGVSKSYAMTGWRLGYGAGPRSLIAAMAVVQSQSTSNPCSISPGGRRRCAERPAGAGRAVARRVPAPPRFRRGAAQRDRRHLVPPSRVASAFKKNTRRPRQPQRIGGTLNRRTHPCAASPARNDVPLRRRNNP